MKFIYDKSKLPRPILNGHEEWVDIYYKAWELAFKNVAYIEKEGWKPMLTCMPGVNITWQWDSCIMTLITNYSNSTLNAFNNLDNLYRLRNKENGFMSMAYSIDTEDEAYPGRINPPLMAWVEWEHYLISGDKSRFVEVLPALEGCFDFIEKNRTRSEGLYYFEDPGSSGMDNAPRGGYFAPDLKGSDVCFVDLACQQAMSAKYISLMNSVVGDDNKAQYYMDEYERICALINKYHWNDKGRYYYDFFARDCAEDRVKHIPCKTAAAFWTIMAGAARGERLKAMVEHLFNEDEFYTKIPFATLSRDDINYDKTGGYWLGGVWAPTNTAAIRGLTQNGYGALAREAAMKYLNAICNVNANPLYTSIWEAYAPEEYRPATTENGNICRADFVGWSGIAPITMLIENIIGIKPDAHNNTVRFDVPREACGIENMQFNGGVISVECTSYESLRGKTVIRVKTQKPIKLVVRTNYLFADVIFELEGGEHEVRV